MRVYGIFALALIALASSAHGAGKLEVEHAWIRLAPPNSAMLAGYAILRNSGDAPLIVTGASSADFDDVSLHESIEENGIEHMRALGQITLPPEGRVEFSPAGKHFMLMQPKRALHAGDKVQINVQTDQHEATTATFVVREAAP